MQTRTRRKTYANKKMSATKVDLKCILTLIVNNCIKYCIVLKLNKCIEYSS